MGSAVKVYRFQATLFPVNAYIVETRNTVVAVDSTLGVSDGHALGEQIKALGKPFAGVVLTHSHPDHYGALTALLDDASIPIHAVTGVDQIIRRDDAEKEQILRPMFGDEWTAIRTFPNRHVADGARLELGDAAFRAIDAGPCESPHDSWWALQSDGPPHVFIGDLVYSHMHPYLADGFYEQWLANIARAKRELPKDVVLMMGHGEPATGHALLDWQADYIHRVLEAVESSSRRDGLEGEALADAVTAQMKAFLPTEDLLFLTRLSVEPLRQRLAKDPLR